MNILIGTDNLDPILELMIMNIVLEIDDLDPKLQMRASLLPTQKFAPIWHSQQTEHANYEYNTRHCLERSCDYWLRMIIGSE